VRKRNKLVQQLIVRCFDPRVDLLERLLAVQELQYKLTTEEARLLSQLRGTGIVWPSADGQDGDEPVSHRPRRVHNRYERKFRKQRNYDGEREH
jgi:hypothetical protein